jgi:hypothetical protein
MPSVRQAPLQRPLHTSARKYRMRDMRRAGTRTWIVVAAIALVLGACAYWLVFHGRSDADPNSDAAVNSPIVQRLLHGARVAGVSVKRGPGCFVSVTIKMSRPVTINDGGITATDAKADCRVTRRATWSLHALRVRSISVELDGDTHRILYVRPNWDSAGAALIDQHWDGAGLGWEPGGD